MVQSTIQCDIVSKVGEHFLPLLDKHFPPHYKFHRIFNRNTVMKTIINSHNHKITNPKTITKERAGRGVDKAKCLLSQNCLINNIIYKAALTSTNPCYKEKICFSTAETIFKLRYSNHQSPFKFSKYKTDTELSTEVKRMEKSVLTPVITWEIVRKCSPYIPNSKKKKKKKRKCYLSLNEKLEIATYQENIWLKKKAELISKYRHQNQYALFKYDTKD